MRSSGNFFTRLLTAVVAVLYVVVCWGQSVRAAQSGSPEEQINVTADSLSLGDGGTRIEATGNVQINREQTTLKADEVRVNRQTQDVEAKGRISLDDPEWKIKSADSIQFNLEKETGEIEQADLFIEQGHVSVSGKRFQKFGGQAYHIDEGFFTTCVCESGVSPWRISADAIDLTREGLGTVRNAYFYVFDFPVLYLPYGFFPLRTERQTGFLIPKFGHSTEEGFRFQQPFFWAISKSTDATIAFDVETRARLGLLGEFRTLFDVQSDFQLHSSYFNEGLRQNEEKDIIDRTIADQHIPKSRWSAIETHRYTIGSDWLTYSDIAAYSDDLFTRELVERFDLPVRKEQDLRVSRYSRSRFGAFRSWRDAHIRTEWDFYQDFIQPDRTTLQATPEVSLRGRRLVSGFPLELRWKADAVNYLRRVGGDGLRVDLRPEAILPFRASSYLFGSLRVAPRETAYHLYEPVKSNDRNVSRELVEVRGNVGSSLSRVFAWSGSGLSAIRHVIEPELTYLFIPSIDQSRIPIMDVVDRVNRRNVVTLAVANRLWGKLVSPLAIASDKDVESLNQFVSATPEIGSLRLALSYDVDRERKGGDSLTDLDINLRVMPTAYLMLGFDGGFNPGPWQITHGRANLTLQDPRPITRRVLDPDFMRPNSFTIGYHYLRRGPNGFLAEDANIDLDAPANCATHPDDPRCPGTAFNKSVVGNLVGNLLYHVTDNILLYLDSTYNVRDSRFIGARAATKLLSSCDCWTVTFSLRRDVNPAKTSFNFDFNLLGLGSQRRSTF
jgi:LPS-assembly protein